MEVSVAYTLLKCKTASRTCHVKQIEMIQMFPFFCVIFVRKENNEDSPWTWHIHCIPIISCFFFCAVFSFLCKLINRHLVISACRTEWGRWGGGVTLATWRVPIVAWNTSKVYIYFFNEFFYLYISTFIYMCVSMLRVVFGRCSHEYTLICYNKDIWWRGILITSFWCFWHMMLDLIWLTALCSYQYHKTCIHSQAVSSHST